MALPSLSPECPPVNARPQGAAARGSTAADLRRAASLPGFWLERACAAGRGRGTDARAIDTSPFWHPGMPMRHAHVTWHATWHAHAAWRFLVHGAHDIVHTCCFLPPHRRTDSPRHRDRGWSSSTRAVSLLAAYGIRAALLLTPPCPVSVSDS